MIKGIALLAMSLGLLGGCATKAELDATNAKMVSMQNQIANLNLKLDAQAQQPRPVAIAPRGCMLGGQLYSPGAVFAGRICEDARAIRRSNEAEEWGWRLRTTNR
ncbi:hypothetical protein [Pseudomonas sp. Marseille-Q5115]|uniref:hypothetical protein n=1 Tax=Pseudomonas sp. Marseille-Q5115 TaxID=2866593 RepID=UPI001CE4B375|nr:hypothetical protein [Pseudomonas sp. Marseille-Q5115]